MAVVKIIELVGSSRVSTDDAAQQALKQAPGFASATSAPWTSSRPASAGKPRRVPAPTSASRS